MRKILVTVVLAGAFWAGGSLPVWACSCLGVDISVHYGNADAVFVASVEDIRDPNGNRPIISSMDPLDYEMYVESVQKGDVAEQVVVRSARESASCGFTFARGFRYQVFARGDGELFETGLCEGTTVLGSPVYEPDGSRSPAGERVENSVGPPAEPHPDRHKPLAGTAAGMLAGVLSALVLHESRRRPESSR